MNITVAFLEKKHCHCFSAFIYRSILIELPTNVKYDNILNVLSDRVLGPRSRSQWLFLEKKKNIAIAIAPSFMNRFWCNFTKMLSMKNSMIKFTFQLSRANVKVAILRNVLLAVQCFRVWTDFDITSYIVLVWQHLG